MYNNITKDLSYKNIISELQPYYKSLISNFSESYLSGSSFYVGPSIVDWWNNYNVKQFSYKKNKLEHIIEIICIHNKKI